MAYALNKILTHFYVSKNAVLSIQKLRTVTRLEKHWDHNNSTSVIHMLGKWEDNSCKPAWSTGNERTTVVRVRGQPEV